MAGIDTLTYWDEDLKSRLEWLTDKQKDKLFEILKYEKLKRLIWKKEEILKYTKENYVTVEKNAEMMWYKWKIVDIDLPSVWNFEWFKFKYFASDNNVYTCKYPPELEKKSYSMNDVWKLLKAINSYMVELQGISDENIDYEDDLQYLETGNYRCNAWDCLKAITWLDNLYWLSDKYVAWIEGSHRILDPHITLNCYGSCCDFSPLNVTQHPGAHAFLRLSD